MVVTLFNNRRSHGYDDHRVHRRSRGLAEGYAFLAEKERRSGSMRTVDSYSRMLQEFFGRLGKPPDLVTAQDVFAYAHGIESSKGTSGRGNKTSA